MRAPSVPDDLRRRLETMVGGPVRSPTVVRVPLRVCPLGAHVDHQGGEVTGLALDRGVTLVVTARTDTKVRLESIGFPGPVEVDLKRPARGVGDWADFLRGVAWALSRRAKLERGFDAVLSGELVGMGVSSSAAVAVAACLALAAVNGLTLPREDVARIVQRSENEFIGVASGLLDQSVILMAKRGCLTHIHCRDFSVDQIPTGPTMPEYSILVAYSGVARVLAETGYNDRVLECREAARRLLEFAGNPPSPEPALGRVDRSIFDRERNRLPAGLRRRAMHYYSEVGRVSAGVEAWRRGDMDAFGRLVTASGESSVTNYESGTPQLIALWETLVRTPGVYGSRFSGGGFGGSCMALVEAGRAEEVAAAAGGAYRSAYPGLADRASFEICGAADSAEVVMPGEA